jgi:pyruvate formate lyase activating enzyme
MTRATNPPLADLLDACTREGELYERLSGGRVRCFACGHRCLIPDGLRGVCKVRFNRVGTLQVPHGYVGALQCDPTEKKPFFHILPGSRTLTFGMLGCDFHCGYCQNWITSQTLRDSGAGVTPMRVSPDELVALAGEHGAGLVGSSYNEPLITAEWAVDVFREAQQAGLLCVFISNGNATPEALRYIRPWTDGYKIDLKSMSQKNYQALGGRLEHVLDTVRMTHAMGFWVEVVTLIVPGWNDSTEELRDAARFIASVSPDIPWHVTAFHKDYKMTDPDNTRAATLLRAAELGRKEGLRFVYAGNLPGEVGLWEHTCCPHCGTLLIARHGFKVLSNRLTAEGMCPSCGAGIPGIWSASRQAAAGQTTMAKGGCG